MTPYQKSNRLHNSLWVTLLAALLLFVTSCSVVPSQITTTEKSISLPDTIASIEKFDSVSNHVGQVTTYDLMVYLIPSSSAIADKTYTVDLYEKGKYRDTATIYWNQPQINVHTSKPVKFSMSSAENSAYFPFLNRPDISGIFTVKVYEGKSTASTPGQTTIVTTGAKKITITAPKNGDVWYVGDKVTITWTTENILPNTEMWFVLRENSGSGKGYAIGNHTTNTGSYQWTVTDIVIGTQLQLEINIWEAHSLNNVNITILSN